MKLKTLSEVVLNAKINIAEYGKIYTHIHDYAIFLKRDLHPSQFIPWDEENNCPLEEPMQGWSGNEQYEGAEMDEYQQAKDKVLFEGFKYFVWGESRVLMHMETKKEFSINNKTIQDLANKVELKDKVAKKLYG